MRIAVCSHQVSPEVAPLAEALAAWADAAGHQLWHAGSTDVDEPPIASADLVVSLGGDGTMLGAVRMLEGAPVPLLGVNLGQLGYLTEVEPVEAIDAVERFGRGPDDGGWHLDPRMLLTVELRRDDQITGMWRALNEAVVESAGAGHTVRLLASIDGEPFTSYAADGLIVATPTGSTAYSLSARGPVVSPRHRALLLTPVSPHMLFDRTVVLDPTEVVDIELLGHRPAELSVDGVVVHGIAEGDVVRCRPAPEHASFVRFGPYRYHQILKAKFGLTDR